MPRPHPLLATLTSLLLLPLLSPPTLAGTVNTQHDVTLDFTGRAHIHVLNTTDITKASPQTDRIGCLNAHGMLVTSTEEDGSDDCAVFTRLSDLPYTLSTPAGNCSFRDEAMPLNRDSVYGRNTHAWSCGRGAGGEDKGVEYYYTINGLNYPFVCNGNLNCYYDTLDAKPAETGGPLPVWQFFWGSQQFDVAKGHSRVAWLWAPVPKE